MKQTLVRPVCRPVSMVMACALALCLFLAAPPKAALAAPAKVGPTADEPQPETQPSKENPAERWQLKADNISAQHDTEILEAEGNVHLWRGEQYMKADFARYYRTTGWVYLRGHVEAMLGKDAMSGEEAEFDLKNKTGWLKNGEIFTAQQNLYFSGEHIEKHQGDTYTFTNGTVTACDGETKAWSIDMVEGEVTLEGYAWLWQPKLNAGGVPVFIAPVAILPAKSKRQSGLLMPEWGSSSRLGSFYNQPLYWAIDDESDATFYFNYMSNRGYQQGLEYRSTTDTMSKGLWKLDFMQDDVVEDTLDDEYDEDTLRRANSTRYWFRSKYDGHLFTPDWAAKLDIDWVSDQNYLREFDNGMLGYNQSYAEFLAEFNRELDDADDLTRESNLLINRSWDEGGIALRAQWVRNLEYENGNKSKTRNDTVQTLPELSGYLWKTGLGDSPLEGQLDAKAANFWREYGTTGSRLDIHPKLSLPLDYAGISVIPTMGLRETAWMTNQDDGTSSSESDSENPSRFMPDFNTSVFTEFFKVYDFDSSTPALHEAFVGDSEWTKIKHSIQPRLDYDWKPYITQSDLPYFDSTDRIPAQNELTYSLTNILDRRRDTVVMESEDGQDPIPGLHADYLEFLNLRVEQSYDIREGTRTDQLSKYPKRPFSDILAELTLQPISWLSYSHRSFFSPYIGEWTETNDSVSLSWAEVGTFTTAYNYNRAMDEYKRQGYSQIRQLQFTAALEYLDPFLIAAGYRINLANGTTLEKLLTLTYRHQCYAIQMLIDSTDDEDRIEFRVTLLGISF